MPLSGDLNITIKTLLIFVRKVLASNKDRRSGKNEALVFKTILRLSGFFESI